MPTYLSVQKLDGSIPDDASGTILMEVKSSREIGCYQSYNLSSLDALLYL